jgi:hypothetical protein
MQNSRLVELAIKGLEAEKARIEQELAELRNHTTARTATSLTPALTRQQPHNVQPAATPKRKMSPAQRKKISETMKKRHAERRAAAGSKKKKVQV